MLQLLPVEVCADIFSHTDLASLICLSQVSKHTRNILSDPVLNPWRPPIMRALASWEEQDDYPQAFINLGAYSVVPRHNFIEILSLASVDFILFHVTLPPLSKSIWREGFRRRFLPSWRKAKDGDSEQAIFKRTLWTVHHRLRTSCSTQQAWCNYLVIHKSGVVNTLSAYTRTYEPLLLFETLKVQSDLAHLDTEVRLVVQFKDVRIIALGVLNRPISSYMVNSVAKLLLHPPGVETTYRLQGTSPGEEIQYTPQLSSALVSPVPELVLDADDDPTTSRSRAHFDAPPTSPTRSSIFRTRSRHNSTSNRHSNSRSPTRTSIFRTWSREDPSSANNGRSPTLSPSQPSTSSSLPTTFRFLRRLTRSSTEYQPQATPTTAPLSPSSTIASDSLSASPFPTVVPSPTLPQPHRHNHPSRPPPIETDATASSSQSSGWKKSAAAPYEPLRHPLPVPQFANYPNYTPGGTDARWKSGTSEDLDENGRVWVGPMLITAQLVESDNTSNPLRNEFDPSYLEEGRFVSFGVDDLMAIAGWLEEKIPSSLSGRSLGID